MRHYSPAQERVEEAATWVYIAALVPGQIGHPITMLWSAVSFGAVWLGRWWERRAERHSSE